MKVFVVGSRGYIARHAIRRLRDDGLNVVESSSHPQGNQIELNLLTPHAFDYSRIQAGDLVLFAAGVSSPDVCHDQPATVRAVNVTGTGFAIEAALGRGARVVFFSSDIVYGHAEDERPESAVVSPAGAYASMKYEVEARFAGVPGVKVLRLSYVFSRTDKFTAYLGMCAQERRSAEIFHPIWRRAIYLNDLLDLLRLVCTSWDKAPAGVINVCGPELLSRVDIANMYREIVAPSLRINVVEPPPGFFQARPQVINMSSRLFERVLGRSPKSLREAMRFEFGKGS